VVAGVLIESGSHPSRRRLLAQRGRVSLPMNPPKMVGRKVAPLQTSAQICSIAPRGQRFEIKVAKFHERALGLQANGAGSNGGAGGFVL